MTLTGPKIIAGPPGPKVTKVLQDTGQLETSYSSPLVQNAEGIYIEDPDGNVFIDLISGRWVGNGGHSDPRVVK